MTSSGIYPLSEAARIADLDAMRVRRWVAGYSWAVAGARRSSAPLIPRTHRGDRVALDFADLVEVLYVRAFLKAGISMYWLRKLHDEARAEFETPHPFASEQMTTDGKTVFSSFKRNDKRHLLDRRRMQIVETRVFDPLMKKIDLDKLTKQASQYWPLGHDRPVVLDPRHAFGEPIVSRSRVPTRVLRAAVSAGQSAERVTRWYAVTHEELEAAIAFEATIYKRAA